MSCCPDLNNIFDIATPIVYGNSQNVNISPEGVITRNGGVPGSSDAFAEGENWVDGTGCAMWVWTVFNNNYPPDDYQSNLINYFIEPEDPVTGVDGWGLSNQFVSFRRGEFLNSVGGGLIYYRNTNLGFNHFAIKYDNGSVFLYETSDSATTDPGWILPQSYSRTGLPTTTRYRLRVTVKPDVNAQSSPVFEFIGAQSPCGQTTWPLGPLGWSAVGSVASPSRGLSAVRFDAGTGVQYYLIPPVSDSGDELRSKTYKAMHATGRLHSASMMAFGYDVGQPVITEDLETGNRSDTKMITRAQPITDSDEVAQSKRLPINIKNLVLGTVRLEGDDRGQPQRDEVHEIVVEQAIEGVRR